MELTGPSLAARLVEEDDWIDERLGGGSRGWGPGSNGRLGKRRPPWDRSRGRSMVPLMCLWRLIPAFEGAQEMRRVRRIAHG